MSDRLSALDVSFLYLGYGMAATSLDDYKRVRKTHGGTVNDVVLATVAGALREWMLTRGEAVDSASAVRAMVPVSVRTAERSGGLGNRVSSYFVDLPVGEPSPVVRLHQVSYAMQAHKESGQSVGAEALIALSGSRRRRSTPPPPGWPPGSATGCSISSSPTSPARNIRSMPQEPR